MGALWLPHLYPWLKTLRKEKEEGEIREKKRRMKIIFSSLNWQSLGPAKGRNGGKYFWCFFILKHIDQTVDSVHTARIYLRDGQAQRNIPAESSHQEMCTS